MSGLWRRNCLYNVQVAGLALHALEPDEEIDVLEHIPGCPSCQAALTDAERVLAQLGGAVEQVQPPVTLRGSILAEAAETVQVPSRPQRVERVPAAEPGVTVPAQHRATSGRRRAADRRPARPGSSRRSRLVAATLALVGIVAIGGLAVRSAQLSAERDAETAQAQTLADIVTGLDEPGTRFATLAAPDGRVLAAVVVRDGRRTLVTSDELAPNAAGDIYVLWGVSAGTPPEPIGTFDVVADGAGVRAVAPDANGFPVYAISLETGRVAPSTPSTVLASGPLEA